MILSSSSRAPSRGNVTINRVDELLPWNVADQLGDNHQSIGVQVEPSTV